MANEESITTKPNQTTSTTARTTQQAKEAADKAAQQAKEAAARAKEGAKQGASQAANEASKMANEVGNEVKQMASDAAHQAEERVNEQKGYAADRLAGVASALRQTGNNFRSQEEETFAAYADNAADQVDRFSGYLREQKMNDLVRDVQQLAKRQPEIFVAGALAAGFFLGRFLKSSEQQRLPAQYRGGYPGQYAQGANSGYRPGYGTQSSNYGNQSSERYGTTAYGEPSYRSQRYDAQNQYGDERYRTQGNQGNYGSSTGTSSTGTAYSGGTEVQSAQEKPKSSVQHEPHAYAAASTITQEHSEDSSNKQQNEQNQTRKEK